MQQKKKNTGFCLAEGGEVMIKNKKCARERDLQVWGGGRGTGGEDAKSNEKAQETI